MISDIEKTAIPTKTRYNCICKRTKIDDASVDIETDLSSPNDVTKEINHHRRWHVSIISNLFCIRLTAAGSMFLGVDPRDVIELGSRFWSSWHYLQSM